MQRWVRWAEGGLPQDSMTPIPEATVCGVVFARLFITVRGPQFLPAFINAKLVRFITLIFANAFNYWELRRTTGNTPLFRTIAFVQTLRTSIAPGNLVSPWFPSVPKALLPCPCPLDLRFGQTNCAGNSIVRARPLFVGPLLGRSLSSPGTLARQGEREHDHQP